MLSIHDLDVITRRLEVTNISRKSAQVIPFVWSTITIYDDGSIFYIIGEPSCSCPWLSKLPKFCGAFLVHRDQCECPECGSPIQHLPNTVPYLKRLAKVAVLMNPLRDLVRHTQRSRRVVTVNQAIQIRIGKEVCVVQEIVNIDKITFETKITKRPAMYIARMIIIASNLRLNVWSTNKKTPDVIYSDGAKPIESSQRSVASYVSMAIDEPVIFSIAGAGAVIDLIPLHPQHNMIVYELTSITGEGTTIHSPQMAIELYRESHRLAEMTPTFSSSPSFSHTNTDLASSSSLMHSSNSFIQSHRLCIQRDSKTNELTIFIENDPVLVFFSHKKNMLHVYTGTNIFRLSVFLDRSSGRLECYSLRDTTHMDTYGTSEQVSLDQLTKLYGSLCSSLPIETLLLIQAGRDNSPWFEWQIVPIRAATVVS